MVQPILFASLGALLATLLGLLFLPFFWRRAVRLTTKRLIDRLPVSASEIVATQDRLRAEQAMAMRVAERKAEGAISDATRDRIESARARATELGHLADLSDLRAKVASLESEGARVRGELDKTGQDAAAAYEALREARAAAESAQRELQAVRQGASASRSATDQARIESAAREAEIVTLRQRLAAAEARPAAAAGPAIETERFKPTVGVAAPRMPKAVDFSQAFPAAEPSAAAHPSAAESATQAAAASAGDAAELADLRRRLDAVADAIVAAVEKTPDAHAAQRAAAESARPLRTAEVARAGA